MPCVAKYLPYMNKIILTGHGLAAEYRLKDYEGVDPDFLITDPNMSPKTWVDRMLQKLPLEHLPHNLMPKYNLGIQPPKFYFGFLLETKQLYETATKYDAVVYCNSCDDEYCQMTSEAEFPDEHATNVENLSIGCTLEKLGSKMESDLKLKCIPRLGFVRDETLLTPVKAMLYILTSYDSDVWGGPCLPEELSKRVVDYLGLKEPLKWYVDYKTCTWYVDELDRRMDISN